MMPAGTWTVFDCPAYGSLHPVHFDGYAGIDGDDVCDCPIAGRLELSDVDTESRFREVVSIAPEDGRP